MDGLSTLVLLSSGLFLGWSLGANDAANVFGTAVASRMVRFTTAAVLCGLFCTVGAVAGGSGPARGLGALGSVDALAGAFTVALAAAITVYGMTALGLPVSTTQAVVGGIVGWNLFTGSPTDATALARIVATWVACPLLGAVFAIVLYKGVAAAVRHFKPHLLELDRLTRWGLVAAGMFGAYSLGANNIANVMGVFVGAAPFTGLDLGPLRLTAVQQLFLLGGAAIAAGGFASRRVMMTVGEGIFPVSPIGAWVVVVAQGLVLFVFSSTALQRLVAGAGLPRIPLVPVSSSQAVVGAVIGVGLCHGLRSARNIRWRLLATVASGWISTPVVAAALCFVLLFVVQNVFQQPVTRAARPAVTASISPCGNGCAARASPTGMGWGRHRAMSLPLQNRRRPPTIGRELLTKLRGMRTSSCRRDCL